jgi:GTP pyrophosphokinase
MRTEFAKLLKQVRKANPEADEALIRRAYRFAEKAHRNQLRKSGDPYITHCIAVANHLVALGMDSTTVSAGMLHDVLEDTEVTLEELESAFNKDIALLVDGVTKIGGMHMAVPPVTREEKQAENLRKMLVATARDVRAIIIKLADRLHNLQTIEFLDKNQIKRITHFSACTPANTKKSPA